MPTLSAALWEAQGGVCWWCGQPLSPFAGGKLAATRDHVFPKSRTGPLGDVGVTLLAHRACNAKRAASWPTDDDIRTLVRVWRRMPPELMHNWRRSALGQACHHPNPHARAAAAFTALLLQLLERRP